MLWRGEGEDPGKAGKKKQKEIFKCWEWDDGECWWWIKTNEGYCSPGQSPQRAVVPMEEEEEEEKEEEEEEEEEE